MATVSRDLLRRYRFFVRHAGGIVGECAKGALALARAEQWAEDQYLIFKTQPDDQHAYCYCDDPKCKYHEGSTHTWETVGVVLKDPCQQCVDEKVDPSDCRHSEILGSLWGIMDPSEDYLRVVRAELALEAMHDRERVA